MFKLKLKLKKNYIEYNRLGCVATYVYEYT